MSPFLCRRKAFKQMIMKRLLWLLPIICLLLCSCDQQTEECPPWLYADNVYRHSLNRFSCTIQDGIITETEYVFQHPINTNMAAGMKAVWKAGDAEPVYTDVEQMEGNNTNYYVHQLPLILNLLKDLPEAPPEDCSISIWMPEEEKLQELLAENDYLICRVGAGTVRNPEEKEVPPYSWQIDKIPYLEYPVLFGALLIEDSSGAVFSLILFDGILT